MLKLRYFVPLILLLLIVIAIAQPTYADTYYFNFTPTSGAAPTGSLTFNGSQFTAFNIDLPNCDVGLHDVEQALSIFSITDTQYFEDIISGGSYFYGEGGVPGRVGLILNGTVPNIAEAVSIDPSVSDQGVGTYTLTDVSAAPEPDTLSLLFVGVVGLGLTAVRKSLRGNLRPNTA